MPQRRQQINIHWFMNPIVSTLILITVSLSTRHDANSPTYGIVRQRGRGCLYLYGTRSPDDAWWFKVLKWSCTLRTKTYISTDLYKYRNLLFPGWCSTYPLQHTIPPYYVWRMGPFLRRFGCRQSSYNAVLFFWNGYVVTRRRHSKDRATYLQNNVQDHNVRLAIWNPEHAQIHGRKTIRTRTYTFTIKVPINGFEYLYQYKREIQILGLQDNDNHRR